MCDHPMRSFWNKVNEMLKKHDHMIYIEDIDKEGRSYEAKVHNLVLNGYLRIRAHGIEYRSIPGEHGIMWISWEPYRILSHFSSLDDPKGTIEYVPIKDNNDEMP